MRERFTPSKLDLPITLTMRPTSWIVLYLDMYRGIREDVLEGADVHASHYVLEYLEEFLIRQDACTRNDIRELHQKVPLEVRKCQQHQKH